MAVIARGGNMKKIICMYAAIVMMLFVTTLIPSKVQGMEGLTEYPLNGLNYYNAGIFVLDAPIAECAKDNTCEAINDPCLLDDSCTAEISCVGFATAHHNGSWVSVFNGGGLSCNWDLFNILNHGSNNQQNDEESNGDIVTNIQNGAVFTIEQKERRSRH